MPGLLGTDVLRRLDRPPFAIFTTAYSEHAVAAFELGAVDYLLKPFGSTRLAAAMERVRSAIGEPVTVDPFERLSGALGGGPISRLFVRIGGKLTPLSVESVSRFEADGDYVIAHVGSARHMLHLALSRLDDRLDPRKFVRVHRAHIVNLEQVRSFRRDDRGQPRGRAARWGARAGEPRTGTGDSEAWGASGQRVTIGSAERTAPSLNLKHALERPDRVSAAAPRISRRGIRRDCVRGSVRGSRRAARRPGLELTPRDGARDARDRGARGAAGRHGTAIVQG